MTWSFSSGVCSLGTTTSAAVRFCSSFTWRQTFWLLKDKVHDFMVNCCRFHGKKVSLQSCCGNECMQHRKGLKCGPRGLPSCLPCQWPALQQQRPSWCESPVWPPPSARRSSPPSVCHRFCPEPAGRRQKVNNSFQHCLMAVCDANQAPIKILCKLHGTHVSWQSLVSFYLKLSFRGSCHNHHPHFRVWSFSWGDLGEKKHSILRV